MIKQLPIYYLNNASNKNRTVFGRMESEADLRRETMQLASTLLASKRENKVNHRANQEEEQVNESGIR